MARSTSVVEVILKGTDQSMTATLKSAERPAASLTSTITAMSTGFLAATAAIGGAVAAIENVIGGSIRAAREFQGFSTRLGVSAAALSELKFAASQNNIAFGQMAIGMQRMTRRVAEAAQGLGEAQGALKELNLDAKALAALAPDKQFELVAASLAQVTGQSDKVRLAFKLFDSEGVGLLQLFDEMGGSMAELRERARTLNVSMSDETVKAFDDAARSIGEVQAAAVGLKQQFALGFVEGAKGAGDLADSIARTGTAAEFLGASLGALVATLTEDLANLRLPGVSAAIRGLTELGDQMNRALWKARDMITGYEPPPVVVPVELSEFAQERLDKQVREMLAGLQEPAIPIPLEMTTGGVTPGGPRRRDVVRSPVASGLPSADADAEKYAKLHDTFAALPEPILKTRESVDKLVTSEQGLRQPIIDLGEEWEVTASTMDDETQRVAAGFLALGKSVEWVQLHARSLSRTDLHLAEKMAEADEAARNLGSTMIDVSLSFADNWANAMGQAFTGVTTFAEGAKAAFRSFASAAVAELNRVIARAIVLATIKAIFHFGDGGSVTSKSGGGPISRASGGPILRAADGIMVPGGFGGGDRVRALLEPGEFVLNKLAVQGLGMGNVSALNARRGQTFANDSGRGRRSVNLNVSISTIMGSRGEAMAAANAFVQYAKASGALA